MTGLELISVVLGGGGLAGSVVAFFKIRPETARITVDAAEGAVVVQTGVITSLKDEVKRLREDVQLEREECDRKLDLKQVEIDELRGLVEELKLSFEKIDERKQKRLINDPNGDGS